MKFEAVIFDMDGLLIDTEPLWQESELEVFSTLGIQLNKEQLYKTMGMRINEVINYWYVQYPWKSKSKEAVREEILDKVEEKVRNKGEIMQGVKEIFEFFRQRHYRMALASSSPHRMIRCCMDRLQIDHYFEVIHSAEEEDHGKPFPDVYLTTARKLKASSRNCLAIEDSPNGLLAALNAGMIAVAVPPVELWSDKRYERADIKLRSLHDFGEKQLRELESLREARQN